MEPQQFASIIPIIGIATGNIFHTILTANPNPTAATEMARRRTESIITLNLISILMLKTFAPPLILVIPASVVMGFTIGDLIHQMT